MLVTWDTLLHFIYNKHYQQIIKQNFQ